MVRWCLLVPVCVPQGEHDIDVPYPLEGFILLYFMIDTFSFVIQQPLFNLQP